MPKTRIDRLKINCRGIRIDTSFVSHSAKGQGARYLMNTDVDPRTALGLAIAVLYAPLGLAASGGSHSEVKAKIEQCQRLAQNYWNDALMSASDGEMNPEERRPEMELSDDDGTDKNEAF